ncbi:HS12A protein, partial [Amia calva]|nr:HS12A protein [Amia calva]
MFRLYNALVRAHLPTCALFNPHKKLSRFGYDAVIKYNTMASEESRKWYFFENFKMELYNKKITKDLMIPAKSGKPFPALTVFSESLRFLKDHALSTISDQTCGRKFISSDVTWVLTVPAIWDAAAKQFMRLAATEAGLVSELDSEQLILALEPEAASMWCKQLPKEGFVGEGGRDNTFDQTPGVQYIAVDCGGGTIDITVHKVLENGSLKELQRASGGGWGGTSVDKQFQAFLKETFNLGVWDRYKREHPGELHRMMYSFSTQKCTSGEEDLYIMCFANLIRCAEEQKEMSEYFKHVDGVSWSDGCITISNNKLRSFFEGSLKRIVNEVEAILSTPEIHIDYILLVGGYASSTFLREEIRQQFSSRCRVLCPYDSQLAIAKGAILFGNDPKIITSRVSGLTYGIAVAKDFDSSVHDPRKRRVNKAGDYVYCADVFAKLVEKGQSVAFNEISEYFYSPIDKEQKSMHFRFFHTEKLCAMYVDEADMQRIGSFTVTMPDTSLGRMRRVRLDIKFGLTEIQATATDLSSYETQAISLDFLTE